jgi:hypothetical protein
MTSYTVGATLPTNNVDSPSAASAESNKTLTAPGAMAPPDETNL